VRFQIFIRHAIFRDVGVARLGRDVSAGGELLWGLLVEVDVGGALLQPSDPRHDRDLFQLANPAQIKAGLPQMKRGPLRFCPYVGCIDVLAGPMIRVQVALSLIRMLLLRLVFRKPVLVAVFIHAVDFSQSGDRASALRRCSSRRRCT
jgi:hypothetical protein